MFKNLIENVEGLVIVVLLTFWAGVIRTIFVVKKRTFGAYITSVFVSIPVGTLAVYVLQEFSISYYMSIALGVTIGIIAHDLIEALLMVFSNKEKLADWLSKKLGIGGGDD